MAEEKAKAKTLKLRRESGEGLKSVVKKPAAETPERKEKDGKEVGRSVSFGRNLVKVGKEFAKSNGRGDEVKSPVKVASKGGKASVKLEGRAAVKEEPKSPVKVASKGKVSVKAEGNANGKDAGKVNGKDSPGVRGFVKAKEEVREKEKGKSSIVKKSPVSTPVKPGSATKASVKSTKVSYYPVKICLVDAMSGYRGTLSLFSMRL